jgi:hypothetical protein
MLDLLVHAIARKQTGVILKEDSILITIGLLKEYIHREYGQVSDIIGLMSNNLSDMLDLLMYAIIRKRSGVILREEKDQIISAAMGICKKCLNQIAHEECKHISYDIGHMSADMSDITAYNIRMRE